MHDPETREDGSPTKDEARQRRASAGDAHSDTDELTEINYNTITSLAALREAVKKADATKEAQLAEEDLFLQRYLAKHCSTRTVQGSKHHFRVTTAPSPSAPAAQSEDVWIRREPDKNSKAENEATLEKVERASKSVSWNNRRNVHTVTAAETKRHGSMQAGAVRGAGRGAVAGVAPPVPETSRGSRDDGSAHKHPAHHAKYYHTVTGTSAASAKRTGAVSRLLDLFRRTPHTPQKNRSSIGGTTVVQKRATSGGAARRGSLGPVSNHRTDAGYDPHRTAAMLFRDVRGFPVADPFLTKASLSDAGADSSQVFVKFFKFHKCYDLMPTSAKLIVLDTQLLVTKAFFALVYNGVRAAPLWESSKQRFVGMLTITDFITILVSYWKREQGAGAALQAELEKHKLETWRGEAVGVRELVSVSPDASLYEAAQNLLNHRIHRLPVIDPETGDVLHVLTHKRLLRFLWLFIDALPRPPWLARPVGVLKLGTRGDIATATRETTVVSALRIFVERRVSALPLLDSAGRLDGLYAKFDAINLAAEGTYTELEATLEKANSHRAHWRQPVYSCTMRDTMYEVMERIVRAEVHRLVVVDDDQHVIGIISLSDILSYLLLRPGEEIEPVLEPAVPDGTLKEETESDQEDVEEAVEKPEESS